MTEQVTEASIREYIAKVIMPESLDAYLNKNLIPMLGNRTWKEVFQAGDQAAMNKGYDYLHDMFGDDLDD